MVTLRCGPSWSRRPASFSATHDEATAARRPSRQLAHSLNISLGFKACSACASARVCDIPRRWHRVKTTHASVDSRGRRKTVAKPINARPRSLCRRRVLRLSTMKVPVSLRYGRRSAFQARTALVRARDHQQCLFLCAVRRREPRARAASSPVLQARNSRSAATIAHLCQRRKMAHAPPRHRFAALRRCRDQKRFDDRPSSETSRLPHPKTRSRSARRRVGSSPSRTVASFRVNMRRSRPEISMVGEKGVGTSFSNRRQARLARKTSTPSPRFTMCVTYRRRIRQQVARHPRPLLSPQRYELVMRCTSSGSLKPCRKQFGWTADDLAQFRLAQGWHIDLPMHFEERFVFLQLARENPCACSSACTDLDRQRPRDHL